MNQGHISCNCRCKFDGTKCSSKQWNNDKCQCECKEARKHCVCKEDYTRNPSLCAWECDKDCEIDEYLKNCICMTSLLDDSVMKM